MSFDRLAEIHFEHDYYNSGQSKRLELKLIPSAESTELIRKKRITIRNNGTSFSLYGDVYNEKSDSSKELKSEFKLSFALIVSDPYFLNASELPIPKKTGPPVSEITPKQAQSKNVYYFHNKRTELIGDRAYLSTAAHVDRSDIIAIRPQRFSLGQLKALTNLSVNTEIKYQAGDDLETIFSFDERVNPSLPTDITRTLTVDVDRFSAGCYSFSYNYESETGSISETADFYLDNQFYGLRPFAVIDLYFYEGISGNFSILEKDFYLSVAARKSYWRYNIMSKFNTFEDLSILADPSDLFPSPGLRKTMSNGQDAVVFESTSKLVTKQILETSYELNGRHIETLGMASSEDIPDEEDEDDTGDESIVVPSGPIKTLPNPKAENLVLEKVVNGDSEETKIFSDLFVYI